jgi:hypothetical protein
MTAQLAGGGINITASSTGGWFPLSLPRRDRASINPKRKASK